MKTLKPKLKTISTAKLKTLEAKAGSTPREHGRSWMNKRQAVALHYGYRCANCKCVWVSSLDQIDHIIPLEQGGSNDATNLQPLCNDCHAVNTKEEAKAKVATGSRLHEIVKPNRDNRLMQVAMERSKEAYPNGGNFKTIC